MNHKETAGLEKVCKSVQFLQTQRKNRVQKKYRKRENEPAKGPVCPGCDALMSGPKMKVLLPLHRRTGLDISIGSSTGQVLRPHGKDCTGNVHTIGPDLQYGIMPDKEELPEPVG